MPENDFQWNNIKWYTCHFNDLRHYCGQFDPKWRLLTGKWPQLTSFGTQSDLGVPRHFCMASFSHNGVPFVKIDQLHDSINYINGPSTQWAIQRLICKRHVFERPYDTFGTIFWWLYSVKNLHKSVFRRFWRPPLIHLQDDIQW